MFSSLEILLVLDLLYVAGSVLFFALMLAYTAACERLGRSADLDASSEEHHA